MISSVMSVSSWAPWNHIEPIVSSKGNIPDPSNREEVLIHVGQLIERRLSPEGRRLVSCLILAYQNGLPYQTMLEVVEIIREEKLSEAMEVLRTAMQGIDPDFFGTTKVSTEVDWDGDGLVMSPKDLIRFVEQALSERAISSQIAELIRARADRLLKWLDPEEIAQFKSAITARVRYQIEGISAEQAIAQDTTYLDKTKGALDLCNQRELIEIYLRSRLRAEHSEGAGFAVEETYDPRIITQGLDQYLRKLLFERKRVQPGTRK